MEIQFRIEISQNKSGDIFTVVGKKQCQNKPS